MDLNKIPFKQSPNFSAGLKTPTHIIIHVTEGGYDGAVSWLCNPKSGVSSHYVISRKGNLIQLVELNNKAWHVGKANFFCIGVEHEGKCNDPNLITPELWSTSLDLVSELCIKYSIPPEKVMGHNDELMRRYGNDHSDPGQFFSLVNYRKELADIIKHKRLKRTANALLYDIGVFLSLDDGSMLFDCASEHLKNSKSLLMEIKNR